MTFKVDVHILHHTNILKKKSPQNNIYIQDANIRLIVWLPEFNCLSSLKSRRSVFLIESATPLTTNQKSDRGLRHLFTVDRNNREVTSPWFFQPIASTRLLHFIMNIHVFKLSWPFEKLLNLYPMRLFHYQISTVTKSHGPGLTCARVT